LLVEATLPIMKDGPIISYVCIGSNAVDPEEKLAAAREGLDNFPGVRIERSSSVYQTEPQEYRAQPWFSNQVLQLRLQRSRHPKAFLLEMLRLENSLGRTRSNDPGLRFGPRTIDIDLLLFDGISSQDPICTLPHPRMCARAFVLLPLAQIAPGLHIYGRPVEDWLHRLAYRLEGRRIFQ